MTETEQRLLQLFDELQRDTIDLHAFFDLLAGNTPADQQVVLAALERLLAQGWLVERGGDFYARTEEGRRALRG